MDETFHPSTLSEILDRTAQLYRSRFFVFLGIAFIPTAALLVPVVAVFLFFAWTRTHPSDVAAGVVGVLGTIALGLVAVPIFVGVSALASAAMSHAASRAILGQATTIRDAYKAVWPRGWRYIGIYLIEILAVWAAPFSAWFALVLFSAALTVLARSAGIGEGGFFAFIGFLIVIGLVAYGVWMSLSLSLAFPACVIEQSGVSAAIKRSFSLAKGTKRRILLLYLLGMALSTILSIAVVVPLIVVLSLLPGVNSPEHSEAVGTAAVFILYGARFAVQALTRPVYGIALMLFYYDQRIRLEAFDIEWMMLKAGLTVPSPPQPAPQPSLPPALVMGNPPPEAAPAAFTELPAAPASAETTVHSAAESTVHSPAESAG
jgi:hypothetical protein